MRNFRAVNGKGKQRSRFCSNYQQARSYFPKDPEERKDWRVQKLEDGEWKVILHANDKKCVPSK